MRGLLYEPDNLSSKVVGEDAHAHICPSILEHKIYLLVLFACLWPRKMTQWAKALAIKSEHLNSVPRTHGVE